MGFESRVRVNSMSVCPYSIVICTEVLGWAKIINVIPSTNRYSKITTSSSMKLGNNIKNHKSMNK